MNIFIHVSNIFWLYIPHLLKKLFLEMAGSDPKKRKIKLEYITVFYTWFPVSSFMVEKIYFQNISSPYTASILPPKILYK